MIFVSDADTNCLRQGDILEEIPFPLLKLSGVAILGMITSQSSGEVYSPAENPTLPLVPITHTQRQDANWLTAQLPVRMSYCAVLSQCCDLEHFNN